MMQRRCATRRDARPSGAARSRAASAAGSEPAVAPNSSSPCGFSTSGADHAVRARRARSRRTRARHRRSPSFASVRASRPARQPYSRYDVLRSSTVVPRRLANGNVRYRTCRMWMCGDANGSAFVGRCTSAGRRHDERDVHAAGGEMADEIVHRALEPADAVERHDGAGDDGDRQRRRRIVRRLRARAAAGRPARRARRPTPPRSARARPARAAWPSACRRRSSAASSARSRAKPFDVGRQQAVTRCCDDVARAARVHRGNRHAERRAPR